MKRKKLKRAVWVLNKYHIRVKKCCASCVSKDILENGTRFCTRMQLMVISHYRCKKWQMSEGLKNAGKNQ